MKKELPVRHLYMGVIYGPPDSLGYRSVYVPRTPVMLGSSMRNSFPTIEEAKEVVIRYLETSIPNSPRMSAFILDTDSGRVVSLHRAPESAAFKWEDAHDDDNDEESGF